MNFLSYADQTLQVLSSEDVRRSFPSEEKLTDLTGPL